MYDLKRHRSAAAIAVAVSIATAANAQLGGTDLQWLEEQGQTEGWTFEVTGNSATQRPLEELCGLNPPTGWEIGATFDPVLSANDESLLALPASFDWRALGGCTPIRNQGGCGACWAFAAAGVMECAILIDSGVSRDLSEQWLVSCNTYNYGCSGGWWPLSHYWNRPGKDGAFGAVLESAKPYTASDSACGGGYSHLYTINSWAYIGAANAIPSVAAIKQAIVDHGPVAVAVYVTAAFQAYGGGVFNACTNGTVNHAVVLVGWDDNTGTWILRNSWGTGWGEAGYMRIAYNCSMVGYAACYINYGSGGTAAEITSPADGATFAGSSVTFNWNSGTGVSEYWLNVGDAPGTCNLYSQSLGLNTYATVNNLPVDGRTIYVRFWSKIAGQWFVKEYTHTAATVASAAADMTSPVDGATLAGASVTFDWSAGSGATEYWLNIGDGPGKCNLYTKSQGLNRSIAVSNLPTDGRTLYVKLYSKCAGVWFSDNYTYTAATIAPAGAEMTSPADGATFAGASVTFDWSAGSNVSEYWLNIGDAPNKCNLYTKSQGLNRTVTVSNLPTDGRAIHVKLYSKCAGVWTAETSAYTAATIASAAATMTSPVGGGALGASSATFDWSAGSNVSEYWLNIGDAPNKCNLYTKSQGLNRSVTVNNLPVDGRTLYVKLYSKCQGNWLANNYTYSAMSVSPDPAEMTSPADGATFGSTSVTFNWSAGTGVTEYWLNIGDAPGTCNLYTQSQGLNQTVTIDGLPNDGRTIYVRFWSNCAGSWQVHDYLYTAAGG